MLSNNLSGKFLPILFILLVIVSCSDKNSKIPVINYQNKTQLLEIVKKHFDKNSNIAFGGIFDESGKQSVVVGREIENNSDWGIKFIQLEVVKNEFEVRFETKLLDGSFKQSLVDKIKFSSFDNELIYYNSRDYYMGSGGGEIYSYIIDFEKKQVYSAHLVIEPSTSVSLFISDNTESKELRNFFFLTFKKDYPELKVVTKDVRID